MWEFFTSYEGGLKHVCMSTLPPQIFQGRKISKMEINKPFPRGETIQLKPKGISQAEVE